MQSLFELQRYQLHRRLGFCSYAAKLFCCCSGCSNTPYSMWSLSRNIDISSSSVPASGHVALSLRSSPLSLVFAEAAVCHRSSSASPLTDKIFALATVFEFTGDIVIPGEGPATLQPVLDRIVCKPKNSTRDKH